METTRDKTKWKKVVRKSSHKGFRRRYKSSKKSSFVKIALVFLFVLILAYIGFNLVLYLADFIF